MLAQQSAPKKGIAYYRHSAEKKQEMSVGNQLEQTERLANENSVEIIHYEADEGKSGLTSKRPGFERLFNNWIYNDKAPDFDYVFVYDVTRWGRWEDVDEAAYWTLECKKHGKKVIYVNHGFPKEDDQSMEVLQTTMERIMAFQFIKQHSEKVFYGSAKLASLGFSVGGVAPYGLTRMLLDENKQPLHTLEKGQHKVISNQRVTFVPANDITTQTIRKIFDLFTAKWHTPEDIANLLNTKDGNPTGRQWTKEKVIGVLSNETYIGTRIYNKTWSRLKKTRRPNPRSEWIVCKDAFEAIVTKETFYKAQERLYWLLPTKWRRGVYKIGKTHKLVQEHLERVLKEENNYHPDILWRVIHNLPIIFGITYYQNSTPHWCFILPEKLKRHDQVIAAAVGLYKNEPVEQYFLLPTKAFGPANCLTFSQEEDAYGEYAVESDKVQEKAVNLCGLVAKTT